MPLNPAYIQNIFFFLISRLSKGNQPDINERGERAGGGEGRSGFIFQILFDDGLSTDKNQAVQSKVIAQHTSSLPPSPRSTQLTPARPHYTRRRRRRHRAISVSSDRPKW